VALAYCTALGLRCGHLIYARGAAEPAHHVVRKAGIDIICHCRPRYRTGVAAGPGTRSRHPDCGCRAAALGLPGVRLWRQDRSNVKVTVASTPTDTLATVMKPSSPEALNPSPTSTALR
jgi:hypothetical protein